MSKRTVVEVICDRCGRMEHVTDTDRNDKKEPDFKGVLHYESREPRKFQDLCSVCRRVVSHSWDRILHYDRKREEAELAAELPTTGPPVE